MNGDPVCPLPAGASDPAFRRALDRELVLATAQCHLAGRATIVALAPDYVRWKDHDGSLVGWRATLRDEHGLSDSYVTVRTAPPHRLAAEAERLQHRTDDEAPGLEGLALVPDTGLLLLGFPLDRALGDLRRLLRPSKVRTLIGATCPDVVPAGMRFSKSRSSFRLVRYKPERRAVLQWHIGCITPDHAARAHATVWLRCHAEATTRAAAAATSHAPPSTSASPAGPAKL